MFGNGFTGDGEDVACLRLYFRSKEGCDLVGDAIPEEDEREPLWRPAGISGTRGLVFLRR